MPGILKLLGNDVLVSPLPDEQLVAGGLLSAPNKYKRPVIRWRVIAVGPGKLEYRKKSKLWKMVAPEVKPRDIILSRFMVDPSISGRRAPHHLEDGTGRVIIDARDIIAVEITPWFTTQTDSPSLASATLPATFPPVP